jgi:hypothetical protein
VFACTRIYTTHILYHKGLTVRINCKTLQGLAVAFGVRQPQEYLSAVIKGEEVSQISGLKFCPQCWNPGAAVDPM